MGTRDRLTTVIALGLAGLLGGCGASLDTPELPPLKSERTFLTPAQQAKAMADLATQKQTAEADALRRIEKSK